jgi:hypothetical protein
MKRLLLLNILLLTSFLGEDHPLTVKVKKKSSEAEAKMKE